MMKLRDIRIVHPHAPSARVGRTGCAPAPHPSPAPQFPERAAPPNHGMKPACAKPVESFLKPLFGKAIMLVTLVAVLCNSQLCLEKVVTTSEQSGITMMSCQVQGQIGIADWLANGPYHEWTLQSYKCVLGEYRPKQAA
jgi:hypothetical protein